MTGQALRSVDVAAEVLNALIAQGSTDIVLAPGSRSGPLALACAAADQQGVLRLHVRIDEREAAFLALGLAKVSRRPVGVITTSGTAVANLHPAMLEALHTGIGLVAITADRPARLRGTGANQTTDQRNVFAGVASVYSPRDLAGLGDGPMHLNLELDEPLIEQTDWTFDAPTAQPVDNSAPPLTVVAQGPRTVVIAGDDSGPAARIAARDGGWPLLAEPTSGARTGQALSAYRQILAHSPLAGQIERVISFGHATLTRPVARLLARTDVDVIHVGDQSTFPVLAGPRVRWARAVAPDRTGDEAWLRQWEVANRRASAAIDSQLDGSTPYDLAAAVNQAVRPGGLLLVGASSPIRDLDLVAEPYPVGERRLIVANRGLAGIDGTISTAVGAALARPQGQALAFMGDLTFLHGSNGLLIGPDEPRPDLTIVVASDDGGSIFTTLEQGAPEYAQTFERVYATPTGADLGRLCAGYGIAHERVEVRDVAAVLDEPASGIRVVEVPVDRAGRRALDGRISQAVRDALSS